MQTELFLLSTLKQLWWHLVTVGVQETVLYGWTSNGKWPV